jgi:uncharacterized integral membrane protein
MRIFSLIALSLTAIIGVSFALLNAHSVLVNFYIESREIPLPLLLVAVLIIGILIGLGILLPTLWHLKYELRQLRRRSGY